MNPSFLQDKMRLSFRTYTVGAGRRAATWGRPYKRIRIPSRGHTLCAPVKNEKRSGGLSVQKQPPTPGGNPPYVAHFHTNTRNYGPPCPNALGDHDGQAPFASNIKIMGQQGAPQPADENGQ